MKHSKCKVFFAIVILVLCGCSSLNVQINNCDNDLKNAIESDLKNSVLQIKQCLSKFKRTDDLIQYTEILKRQITVTCDPKPKPEMLALAEHPDSVFFPGLKIFTGIYNKDNENSQLQAILAHESIHWMGYEHYKNFDLSYVAEMCCLDHKDDFLNEIGQKSCEMFKFKNKEWTNPEYVGNLTKNLGYFGRHFVGLATSFAAAIHSKQLNVPKKDIFKIFEYTAFAYADGSDSDDPKTTKYYASSPDVTQAIVLAYLTENQESTFNKVLLKKYFNNKNKTLRFFRLFSQTISHLIFGSNSDLIQSWLKFKNYEKEICPNLETYEKEALAEMAFYTYENLFDKIKTEGATLDELRMLTDWTKICGPKTPVLKSI